MADPKVSVEIEQQPEGPPTPAPEVVAHERRITQLEAAREHDREMVARTSEDALRIAQEAHKAAVSASKRAEEALRRAESLEQPQAPADDEQEVAELVLEVPNDAPNESLSDDPPQPQPQPEPPQHRTLLQRWI